MLFFFDCIQSSRLVSLRPSGFCYLTSREGRKGKVDGVGEEGRVKRSYQDTNRSIGYVFFLAFRSNKGEEGFFAVMVFVSTQLIFIFEVISSYRADV